jgi:hypothetical protein
MRNLALGLTLGVLIAGAARPGAAQEPKQVSVTRLYTGADGLSHFESVEMRFSPEPQYHAPNGVLASEPAGAKKSYFVRAPSGLFEDWHNADVRRYVVTISGRAEIEVAGGKKFDLGPGDVGLAEDLTGKGHTFRVVGDSDWVALFVDLEE